jgi:hypothetical protein
LAGSSSESGAAALTGLWVHSHEEDGPGETVYRPQSYPMPPSRGRSTLNFAPDGSVTRQSVGVDDRPGSGGTAVGQWQRAGAGGLQLTLPSQGIVRLEQDGPDKLILKVP